MGSYIVNQRKKYLQQRSKVFTPDYRPCNLWKYYIGAAVVSGLMSIALAIQTSQVKQVVIDYSGCEKGKPCVKNLDTDSEEANQFPIEGPILIYYYIDNFHQNHRGYEDDRDDNQLAGTRAVGKDCSNNTDNVLPCGFAANTMFTDKIEWIKHTNRTSQVKGEGMTNPKLKENLSYSLESDAYTPPENRNDTLNSTKPSLWDDDMYHDTLNSTKPSLWDDDMYQKYLNNDQSFLEDFRVWMRLAPLPEFRKLWYRMPLDQMPRLEKGFIKINVRWPSNEDKPKKKVILTQQSFMGAKCYNKCYISGILAVIFAIGGMVLWHLASVDEKYETKKIKVEEKKQKKRLT